MTDEKKKMPNNLLNVVVYIYGLSHQVLRSIITGCFIGFHRRIMNETKIHLHYASAELRALGAFMYATSFKLQNAPMRLVLSSLILTDEKTKAQRNQDIG